MAVHIKISDRNWILETMAQNLSSRLDYVSYDTNANPNADIQYYMTYSTHRDRVSPVELAYFTHLEEDPTVAARFFATAKAVDASVCMSQIYADILAKRGVKDVHIIPPGVDLERFNIKLRIGIIGRTYVTGRKGEALMAQVMGTPGVEFIFTGDGWPSPGLHLKPDEMPGFYSSLDYVLVPAQYEGGPMSAIEALACGVEVIAPPVGWMPELPHISYETNDAADLRRVLDGLVQLHRAHRTAVLDRSWNDWAKMHDELFRKLLPKSTKSVASVASAAKIPAIQIVTHGMESVARGGPSTRIPQLDAGLNALGYDSKRGNYGTMPIEKADLFHLFNVATPKTAGQAMAGLKSFGRPVVFSPIYLDNRCRNLWAHDVPAIFDTPGSVLRKMYALKTLQHKAQTLRRSSIQQSRVLPVSYHQEVTRLLEASDEVIYLSRWEKEILKDATGVAPEGHIVFNPVQTEPFRAVDPFSFRNAYTIDDYVLCVGRVEPRKNQLVLAAALSGTGIPLVLAGACFDEDYIALIRAIPDLVLIETGHVESGSEMLMSAFAGCRVFCLPSWSEGAPIAALEAAAAGCRMVLSSYSSEREYFGERATYVDPANAMHLRSALQEAYDSPFDKAQRADLSDFTQVTFSVDRHIERTREIYDSLLARDYTALPRSVPAVATHTVYFDITTLLNNPGRVTGITRVELSLIRSINPGDDISFIAWHADRDFFFHVDEDLLDFESGPNYRLRVGLRRIEKLPENSALLLQGNAWLRNGIYVMALERLVRSSDLRLTVLIHDIMPISKPQYFEAEQTAQLGRHLDQLSAFTSTFCADSHATRSDLETYFLKRQKLHAPIQVIRLGDGLDEGIIAPPDDIEGEEAIPHIDALLEEGNFVLSVGSQLTHKNRNLLLNVWNRLSVDLGRNAPTLVIVGKTSAQVPDSVLDQAARAKVVKLQALSDGYLDQLYRKCLFTVFPSLCEGWGLPVAESLVHGKICVASDASSMQEIAPECTDLIDPLDTMAWYRKIRFYATSAEGRRLREETIAKLFKPTPWRATLDQLTEIALNSVASKLAAVPWDLERRFDTTDVGHRARLAFTRSHNNASEGSASTTMVFALTYFSDAPIFMKVLCGSRTTGDVEVVLNGEIIDTLFFGRDPETVHSILLPSQAGTQRMQIEFRDIKNIGFELSQFVLMSTADNEANLLANAVLSPLQYAPTAKIDITKQNVNIKRLLVDSWHKPEVRASWSGRRARLHLPLGKLSEGALEVSFKYSQLEDATPVFVDISGLFGTVMDMRDPKVRIPAWAVAQLGSYLDIGLYVPSATSPEELGIGEDKRVLGIYLESLLYDELPIDMVLHEAIAENPIPSFAAMLGNGWHQSEPYFVWSDGLAQLKISTLPTLHARPVLSVGTLADHTLHIFADCDHILSIDLKGDQVQRITLPILRNGRSYEGVNLTLTSSIATSPLKLGISSDARHLGIRLEKLDWVTETTREATLPRPHGHETTQGKGQGLNSAVNAAPLPANYSVRVKRKIKLMMGAPKG